MCDEDETDASGIVDVVGGDIAVKVATFMMGFSFDCIFLLEWRPAVEFVLFVSLAVGAAAVMGLLSVCVMAVVVLLVLLVVGVGVVLGSVAAVASGALPAAVVRWSS